MAKYNEIKTISLKGDDNEYQIGITGSQQFMECDFYVNDELLFEGIPYNKGKSISVLESGFFIKVRDSQGRNRIIRNGKIVFSTRYPVVNAFAKYEYDDCEYLVVKEDVYLIVVSKKGLRGIYSSKGYLVLPIEYSTIDIDDAFNIVLGKKEDLDMYVDELKEEMLKSVRKGEYMQIGKYIKKYGYIETKPAIVDGDVVYIVNKWNERYSWNDGFSDYEFDEDDDLSNINVPNWDDYSYRDSLYDALGGEMDAAWNID